jgi:phage tail P2-like protein
MPDRLAPDVIALDARFAPLAESTKRIEQLPLDGLLTYLVETVPAAFLPELARQLHIGPLEGWQFVGTDADRRRLIREAIALHRKKGTPWALRRAFQMAGFGDQLRIIEGALTRRYNGTIFADGSEKYGGHTWAEFRVEADLGEKQGLAAETAAMAQALIAEWKPVSRHLTSLAWTVQTSDTAPSADAANATAAWSGESLRPWRRMYDGQHRYDQGVLLAFDGATLADGSRAYQGWAANDGHWRAGEPESDTTLALAWADADRQQRLPLYDGATQADGSTDYGDAAPVAEDAIMPITVTRFIRFDGRYRYGADNTFNGTARFDGSRSYFAGRVASGHEITYLEAA